ncbi:SMI1/KNR4 family protein [Flavobacterium tiangeerense]|uniref:SMI1/KNR4 family protein n=1 Tax=Flavobacterium tiangeerense TaxID=459471 RepID=UPI00119DF39E|nr:SMI1/KNR4 family protein [Flavobacterium tiangeerense]
MVNKIKHFEFKEKNESIIKFIDKIENEIGIIPRVYKEFLLKYNGGLPNNDFDLFYNRKKTYSISLYYGFYNANKYDHASIKDRLSFLIFPEKTIPIATDGVGNDYLLFIDNGSIYFWNHENSDVFNKNLKNLKKVANSFSELIGKIEKSSPINRDIKITETDTDFIIE